MRVVSRHDEQGRGLTVKFALVLLCLVALELVLSGHHNQVQSVKALKRKIYLKKLRKILPFLALVKPKKKLILVPIPIPMYNKQPYESNYQGQAHHMHMMSGEGSSPPMSFMMMTEPNMMTMDSSMRHPASHSPDTFDSAPLPEPAAMMMPSMTMTIQSDGSGTMSAIELGPASRPAAAPSVSSLSQPLPPNNTVSGALIAGQPSKWLEQQQQQQQQLQQYDYDLDEQFLSGGNLINESPPPPPSQQAQQAGGEHYYSSPWQSNRPPPPLASPAKYLRKERLRQSQSQPQRPPHQQQQQQRPVAAQSVPKPRQQQQQRNQQTITVNPKSGRLIGQEQRHQWLGKQQQQSQRFSAPMPVLIIKNQWRPSAPVAQQQQQQQQQEASVKSRRQNERVQQERHLEEQRMPQLTREQERQISQALEQESLIQVGPAQMLPIYQSPSGRLSMTPPPPPPSSQASLQSTSTIASVATGGDTSSSSFDHESSVPLQSDLGAEVQTIGSGMPASFFHPPTVGDTPTATEISTPHVDASSSPADSPPPGEQHTASEPTIPASQREQTDSATTATTTNATVSFTSAGRLVAPAVKGARSQSSPPPPPPPPPSGGETKYGKAGAQDFVSY